jgi:hypothetical protein
MKTKRARKRYTSRAELLADIEDTQWKLKMAVKKCGQHEDERKRLKIAMLPLGGLDYDKLTGDQRDMFHVLSRQLKAHTDGSDELLKSMPGLNGQLARLKEALGQFDTEPMAFMEDRSVQV